MAENTKIEWCDHTFNPWIGCAKVSPACDHCYAEKWGKRFDVEWGQKAERRRTSESTWQQPLRWNAKAKRLGVRYRVFCASLADVFDSSGPSEWRYDLFNLILSTPHIDWLLLTKRIGNTRMMIDNVLPDDIKTLPSDHPLAWPWPHVWIGITVCNQEEADRDIPKLLAVPAVKRFVSIEPMLGAIKLDEDWLTNELFTHADGCDDDLCALNGDINSCVGKIVRQPAIDWVICGGETGPGARPMHPEWARSLRDQCQGAGVPFFFKQWGEWASAEGQPRHLPVGHVFEDFYQMIRLGKKKAGRMLDGREWNGVPA